MAAARVSRKYLVLLSALVVVGSSGCMITRRLDALNSQLEQTNEHLQTLQRLDDIDAKLAGTNERLDRLNAGVAAATERLGALDETNRRLAQVNERLAALDETNRRLGQVEGKLDTVHVDLGRLSSMDKKLDRLQKLDDMDAKLAPVEETMKRLQKNP
jgi:DNA repair ATPase RecN